MLQVLRGLSKEHNKLSIATGYWDLNAIAHLLEELNSLTEIRLLIGREPLIPRHSLSEPEGDFPGKDFKFDLAAVEPTSNLREAADAVTKWIASEKLQVKLFTRTFLHAKTYIFGDFSSDEAVGVIGSSNFTGNGLTSNTELNALESDHRIVTFQPKNESQETGHLTWFESMWSDQGSIEWSQQFGEIIESSPVGNKFFSPFETYIKTLHTLYKDELDDLEVVDKDKQIGRSLFDFQKKNTQALQRRLNKYKVAMLADSVGLGKTTTAINVMRNYLDDPTGRKRVEIICPKSIVHQWEKELTYEGIFGQSPITLQNSAEIEKRQDLDQIAAVSLFVIDESHNLRSTTGVRFQQMVDWVRNNPKAHVLLLTATPINNNLGDLTNQILLGSGGNAEIMKVTVTDKKGQTTQLTFHQAVENLKKKINQDLKRTGIIDYEAIREVMAPIIRAFVVRRTRQGIQQEYGSLTIDGEQRSFPKVVPGLIEYTFSKKNVDAIKAVKSEEIDVDHVYQVLPSDLIDKCKNLAHPYTQALALSKAVDKNDLATGSPMFYIFQLILLLGFVPYRWMMYQNKYHGKTRDEIGAMRIGSVENKKLLQQLGIFGILRTVFLKRMESSVSALRSSLKNYHDKLAAFENGIKKGRIVSVSDLSALEASFGDEDLEVDEEALKETTLDEVDEKKYDVKSLLADIKLEKEIIRILDEQLQVISKDDAKIKELAREIDLLRANDPKRKILVFSYFSDTVKFLEDNLFTHSNTASKDTTGFLSSKNRADAEHLASRFSPKSKIYDIKEAEKELSLLVSTDVLSEGQNLQDAGVLINFDLHWNPVRMIQRNGRVNRLGSIFDEVNVYNMKPESELDGYLRLIQRLQGKIDIIRNTIGTDTPVLDEVENPIEYKDALSEIYSHDIRKRMKALDDAERAGDYLLSEDEFIMDLKKFYADPAFTDQYKEQIFEISEGKWALFPKDAGNNPPIMGLSALSIGTGEVAGYQFVELDGAVKTVRAVSPLRALALLRTSAENNLRTIDKNKIDRPSAQSLIERGAKSYSEAEETGALIGQENEVLHILYKLEYSEDEINLVRDGFKTNDVLYRRQIDTIKRQLMTKSKRGESFQNETRDLLAKAVEIFKNRHEESGVKIENSRFVMGYIDGKLNA
jgi:ERCC4-related helicase